MAGGTLAGLGAIEMLKRTLDIFSSELTRAHIHHGAHNIADHVFQKAIAPNIEDSKFWKQLRRPVVKSMERFCGVLRGAVLAAVGREITGAHKLLGDEVKIAIEVLCAHMPSHIKVAVVAASAVPNEVAVVLADCVETGVKRRIALFDTVNANASLHNASQDAIQPTNEIVTAL